MRQFVNIMRESFENKKTRAKNILKLLKKHRPKADCALHHKNPVQLLVATILSAQCTDKRVNFVTKNLFKKYKTAKDFAKANIKDLEKAIHSTGFFRSKALKIKSTGEMLEKNFKGKVPAKMTDLTSLAGVGRKTANVILGTAFGQAEGIVVDTHVSRLSFRLGLTAFTNPLKIEKDLTACIPKNQWIYLSHALIWHGREVCKARKPQCASCFLEKFCPKKRLKT